LTVVDYRKKMARSHIDIEGKDDEIKQCEWKISSHDVPQPVPADIRATDASHVIGVGQRVVVRQTPPTKRASSVQRLAHHVIELMDTIWKFMIHQITSVVTAQLISAQFTNAVSNLGYISFAVKSHTK
jgi:hypothetical protein